MFSSWKKMTLVLALLALPATTHAAGCNLKNIPFGDNAKKIASKFSVPEFGITNIAGDAELNARGTGFCDAFPASTQAKLVFVGGELVRVEFSAVGTGTALYDAANGKISKSLKNPKKPNANSPKKIGFSDMWDDKTSSIGLYSQSYNAEGVEVESLVISSRKHAAKVAKASMDAEATP
jgi:hypothetical protein